MSDPNVRDRIVDRCRAVLENDLGIAPSAASFVITSEKIEEWMKAILEESGIRVDDSKVGISVKWNPQFNREIQSNQKHVKNIMPFSVKVGYRIDESDIERSGISKKTNSLSFVNHSMRRQLMGIMNGAKGKAQMSVMDNEELNNILAKFCYDGNVKWRFADKKSKRIMYCKLDIDLVMKAMFRIDSEKGKKFNWDIRIVDAIGPGTRSNGPKWVKSDKQQKFTVIIQKRFNEQTYRAVNGDMKNIKKYLR